MKPKSVDEYIASCPKEVRGNLKELRAAIKEAAPEAVEKISYGMPYYFYKGRLAYFAAFKNHISLFAVPPVVEEYKDILRNYKISKSTIQFPIDQELPISLIKELIRARVKKNEIEYKSVQ